MLLLGTDNDMEADWDNGIFYAGADPRRGYKALAY